MRKIFELNKRAECEIELKKGIKWCEDNGKEAHLKNLGDQLTDFPQIFLETIETKDEAEVIHSELLISKFSKNQKYSKSKITVKMDLVAKEIQIKVF